MSTESCSPSEDLTRDRRHSIKTEPTSPSMESTGTVVLAIGHALPEDLMGLLRDWHRENPNLEPPGSYRNNKELRSPSAIWSRTEERLSEVRVQIISPVRYAMLVIQGEHEPRKFVRCISQGDTWRIFFKEWLGSNKLGDKACAVRIVNHRRNSEPGYDVTEEMWRAADLKNPLKISYTQPRPTSARRQRESSSDGTDDDASTSGSESSDSESAAPLTRNQKRRRITETQVQRSDLPRSDQNGRPEVKIVFELVAPKFNRRSDGRLSFTVTDDDTGDYVYERCRTFFRHFDRRQTSVILSCKSNTDPMLRYIGDTRDMDHLLEKLREQGKMREELIVEVELSISN